MHKLKLLILLAGSISVASVHAQKNNEPLNSGEVLENCIKFYADGNYKKVIEACKTVSRNDTNYSKILHELAYASYLDSEFNNCLSYAKLGMEQFPEKTVDWFNLLGNAYDALGKSKEAIDSYDSILVHNPYYYQGWYNKGIVYYNKENYTEAKKCMQKALMIFPFHASSHYFLGVMATKEGKIVPAMMSFSTCLLTRPEGKYAGSCITYLSNIARVTDDVTKYISSSKEWADDDFELLQEIIVSKAALNAKYKLKTAVEDPVTRQLQAMLEKLEYNESDKGFWMQYYVPFYTKIFKEQQYDLMVNYMFSSLDIKSIKNFNQKNDKKITAFVNEATEYFSEIRRTEQLLLPERTAENRKYYFSDGSLLGIGSWRINGKDELLTGPWTFYYENGNVKSKGKFSDKGDKIGEWEYYHENGVLKQKCTFKDDKVEGKVYTWYNNGVLSEENEYKNDKLNGPSTTYFFNGFVQTVNNYVDNKKEEQEKHYTYEGFLNYIATFKNNELDGIVTVYHNNNKPSLIKNYSNGKLHDVYKTMSKNGVVTLEGNYDNGKQVGEWKEYYTSGNIKSEYSYKDGSINGVYKLYHENGKVEQTLNYTNGRADGREEDFDEDGIKYCESVYENGRLRELTFFDKKGNTVNNFTTRKGAGNLIFYDAHGTKKNEGYFNKDGYREGKSTYYFPSGKVSTEANFKEGSLEGERIIYYANGKMSEKINFTNDEEHGMLQSLQINGNKRYSGYFDGGYKQGEHISYDLFGTPAASYNYLNNDQNGYTVYYSANGKKDYEEFYKNGWLQKTIQYDTMGKVLCESNFPKGNGDLIYKHYNGKTYIKITYRNYMQQGNYEGFFFDGTPSMIIHYKNGYRDSIFRSYFYGGKVKAEGLYSLGEKTGEWKYYYSSGKLNYIENYVDGEEEGIETIYNEDGTKDKVISYKKGELDGPYTFYGDNNAVALQLNYRNGLIISYTYNGKDGKLVKPIPVKNGTALITAYYANGNKSAEIKFENSQVNGVRKFYYQSGEIFVDGERIIGYDNGSKKTYYEGNKIQREESYYYGNLHGIAKSYYPNGKIKKEENWYNGELNGASKFYDETGKLKETRLYYYDQLLNVIKE